MVKALPFEIPFTGRLSYLFGIILKEYGNPKCIVMWISELEQQPKELNIDMKMSFKIQFQNIEFQKAQIYFHVTSITLVILIHFVFEERRILSVTYVIHLLSPLYSPG